MTPTDLEALADELLADEDGDLLDAYIEARHELTYSEAHRLAKMLEICPIHVCDAAICADDENEVCAPHRA